MDGATLLERVAALARSASIEVSPREIHVLSAAQASLPQGALVTITWMPRDSEAERVTAARAVRSAGFKPMPHIAARYVRSEGELRGFLQRLRDEADVRSVFVVGGDVERPHGPFSAALDLIGSGILQAYGVTAVGVAGYPEAHPAISADALEAAYNAKRHYLARAGLDAFVVTQFCFDAAPIAALLRQRRGEGDPTLIRVGLAGPASFAALLRFAARCGVTTSARVLWRQGDSALKLLGDASPEPILEALAALPDAKALQPFETHFFSFGGFARTAAWLASLSAGVPALMRRS